MKKILLNIIFGIGWGCTIFVFIAISLSLTNSQAYLLLQEHFISQAIAAIIVSIGFCLPSIVYSSQRIPRSGQVAIHLGSGFIIFLIVAFCAGWIPFNHGVGAIALFFLIAIVTALLIWCGFYLYHRSEARKINAKLQERRNCQQ